MSEVAEMPKVRGRLTRDAPLAPLVWFKTGGKAGWLFEPADAEDLPYADGSFDAVLSVFGAMFAPNQPQAAAELLRVPFVPRALLVVNIAAFAILWLLTIARNAAEQGRRTAAEELVTMLAPVPLWTTAAIVMARAGLKVDA